MTPTGQFYFHLLKDFNMTPQEWRELDPRDAAFLANGYNFANKKANTKNEQFQREAKHRRR